jgi:hypothetical protein
VIPTLQPWQQRTRFPARFRVFRFRT